MAAKDKPVVYKGFTGKNNIDPAERLVNTALREAENVDIDRTGRVSRRKGYTKVLNGSDVHSLWSNGEIALFVQGGELRQLAPDYSTTTLRTGLQPGRRMEYIEANGTIYYSNGLTTGSIRNGVSQSWGLPTPAGQPTLAAVLGGLPAGVYQVAVTYVDAQGRESGATLAATVQLPGTGGILVNNLPSSPEASSVRVYASSADGDGLHQAAQVPVGTASVTLTGGLWTRPLRTQFVEPAPAGQLLAYLNGRLWVAVGNLLYVSQPYALEWFRVSQDVIPFPEEITLLGAVEDGLFVAADRTYFLQGTVPGEQTLVPIGIQQAVLGTMVRTDRANTGRKELSGDILIWVSNKGIIMGSRGGTLENVTDARLAVPVAVRGSAMMRTENGMGQFVGVLKSPTGEGERAYLGDVPTARVVRNGITV